MRHQHLNRLQGRKKGVYELLTMEKRMNEQALPTVEIVDMREELRDGIDQCFLRRCMKK